MKKLMYAELTNGVSMSMMEDRKIVIISDSAIFLVAHEVHTSAYPELEFFQIGEEAISDYELEGFRNRTFG
jgi:hypothetical protein